VDYLAHGKVRCVDLKHHSYSLEMKRRFASYRNL
jgi:hypothetical protein